jgi:hypothetical protein
MKKDLQQEYEGQEYVRESAIPIFLSVIFLFSVSNRPHTAPWRV